MNQYPSYYETLAGKGEGMDYPAYLEFADANLMPSVHNGESSFTAYRHRKGMAQAGRTENPEYQGRTYRAG